jgi:hypothetical protein
MRKNVFLEPLYHFDFPSGQARVDRMCEIDRARAQLRGVEILPEMQGAAFPERRNDLYARMNF